MLIFGHPWIKSFTFVKVFSISDIEKLSSEDIALLEPLSNSVALAQYCQENKVDYAVPITGVREAILANALESKYIICQQDKAAKIQSIAQEYLFDTKVLTFIENEKEIEEMAEISIDGVVFYEAIRSR